MAVVKVHGSTVSTATNRVLACLYEKEVDFQFIPVDMYTGEHKKEPYISLNPFGQVPAFEDGDLKLFESRAITKYLCNKYAGKGTDLIYSDANTNKRADAAVWMEVEAHQFEPLASKLIHEIAIKPLIGLETDNAIVADSEPKMAKVLDVYEARLQQSKYLGGDTFGLADLHHLPNLHYLMRSPIKKLFDSRELVSSWCADIMARAAWTKVVEM